ncbi:gastrula zinc finger protein XlCGF8.2DB-like [Eupeodes corollae]|uniref:gastrula zinc finger protein XlCGF8.2DB-like n=1 Tax=Eupeodes corollae TaxID=290404 RepID=UPI0024921D5C|nr:gastrula zinc finger protein XlCGF8.2DB-like [Eupeodes corollae]
MNFNKMCRICGETIKGKHSETIDDNKTQIYKYLPIKDSDESFPKNLCVDCLDLIDSWDVFYKRCEKSQQKFASLLKNKKLLESISLSVREDGQDPDADADSTLKLDNVVNVEENGNNVQLLAGIEATKQTKTPKQTNNGSFSCNFCLTCTTSQPELNDHLIAMHCDLVFCCDLCKNYKPRDDLITHMTEHALSSLQNVQPKNQPKIIEKIQCTKCDKQFTSNSGLKYHMNSNHTLVKQFNCDECHHEFPCKRVLLNHIRSVHSKDKPFKCVDCGKHFKTDSTLYAHRKTHSKEAPHKCFDCGKGFKFKHHLESHLLQHKTKEKTFECSFCHKKFAALNNLTKHRKIHDNTSDFSCHICGVKMMQKRYLKDHMKRVHQTRLD